MKRLSVILCALTLAACNPGPSPSRGFGPDGTFTRAANMCADAMGGLSFAQVSAKHGLKPGLIGFANPASAITMPGSPPERLDRQA